ncbi:major capsid protein [Fibrella sp. ES10-3-2-2]|nr:hypothetical protein A6C57_00300 [Fibrella sp. ES10-3-2-2]
MAQVLSIFGDLAKRLQIVIDRKLDAFEQPWYDQYFDMAPAQASLSFTSVIGKSRIEAAASVVNRDSLTPLRSRASLDKLTGEIPAIKEKIKMTESDYREYKVIQAMGLDQNLQVQQALDLLYGDVKKVGDSAHKRLDIMALEAVSTGQISLTIVNNPDGLVLDNPVDLLMPLTNRIDASVMWTDAVNADPFLDIQSAVDTANDRGIVFAKMLMAQTTWQKMRATKKVRDLMTLLAYGKSGAGDVGAATTLAKVNQYLADENLPIIEVVNKPVGIEKDGKPGILRPFSEKNVSFIPAGKLGDIKNAYAIEETEKVDNVVYGTYKRALISKWKENEPFAEWTKVELNAIPALTAIDSIHLLKVVA